MSDESEAHYQQMWDLCSEPLTQPSKGPLIVYTVLMLTNMAHKHPSHPPQVVYIGSNGEVWSLPLDRWPGNLERSV